MQLLEQICTSQALGTEIEDREASCLRLVRLNSFEMPAAFLEG